MDEMNLISLHIQTRGHATSARQTCGLAQTRGLVQSRGWHDLPGMGDLMATCPAAALPACVQAGACARSWAQQHVRAFSWDTTV